MKTLQLSVDPSQLGTPQARAAIERAAEILRAGGTVALPTETVYGLGANALDSAAVARIFAAKQRPSWDPVIVHIAGEDMLEGLVLSIPEPARKLMAAFWPGPMTLLLPRSPSVPDSVTAGRLLVGIRMPAHPVALALIRCASIPIAAPSANTFGRTSPTTAAHVLEDLDGRIDAVLDAGPAVHGVESTVLDPGRTPMVIYRPGAVTAAQIREVAGEVEIFRPAAPLRETPEEALPSPGVGLRHYAPKAKLILVEASLEQMARRLADEALHYPAERLGFMLPTGIEAPRTTPAPVIYSWGRWQVPAELAQRLYAGLRRLDAQGCTVILCPLPAPEGIGAAIRDRLGKASQAASAAK